MKVIALSVDDDDEVRTQVFANERDLFEHLRVNYTLPLGLDVDPATPEGQKAIHDDLEFQRLAYKWDWHEVPLNIEILHTRPSDSGCDHTVFVNGEQVVHPALHVENVDPGSGWGRRAWKQATKEIERGDAEYANITPAFRVAIVRERKAANNNGYWIED